MKKAWVTQVQMTYKEIHETDPRVLDLETGIFPH